MSPLACLVAQHMNVCMYVYMFLYLGLLYIYIYMLNKNSLAVKKYEANQKPQ